MIDRCTITEPPEYDTRMEADDLPEALGDEFALSPEEKAKINAAANWGRNAILIGLTGDPLALQDLRRIGIVRWEHRSDHGRCNG